MTNLKIALAGALLGTIGVVSGAQATPIISVSTTPTFTLESFGTGMGGGVLQPMSSPLVVGGETFTFTNPSGVYSGNLANVVASPFGNANTDYLAAEPGGTLNIAFATPQTAFDLLWGSVDAYNSLTTFNIGGQVITGADILAADPALSAGSSNAYVQISGLNPFTSISVTSTSPAFEFVPGVPVPEPLTLSLFGAGLAGAAALRRRKKSKQA